MINKNYETPSMAIAKLQKAEVILTSNEVTTWIKDKEFEQMGNQG